MKISLTTPALLFSAISLLLLAYTNRFLSLASLVRTLHSQNKETPNALLYGQITNVRKRLLLIRNMQVCGLASLLLCVVTMFLFYIEHYTASEYVFGIALLLLIISLAISTQEIFISVHALNIHLSDLEERKK